MKYQVQIQYTNPSHEHVSLRRRVDTITRVVEAANEAEALNRAANQQRSLGFLIKEAAVMKGPGEENRHVDDKASKKKKVIGGDNEKTDIATAGGADVKEAAGTASYPLLKPGQKIKPMKMKMGEGFDPDPKDIAAQLVKKHGKGKVTKDHVDAYERDRDSNKAIDKEAVMKHVQKMSEEVELDEAQKKLRPSYWKAEWRMGTQSEVDKNNKKIFDRLAKTDPVKAAAFHDNLMRMKKKDVKEEVEHIDEKINLVKAKMGDVVKDFYKSKAPQFKDKSMAKRREMAVAAKLGAERDAGMREEVEQIDEVKAVKAYDKEGKLVGRYRSMDHAKQMKPGHTYKVEEGVEQVDEANMRFDPEAAARPKSSDVKNFLNRDKNPRAAAASKKYIRRMTKLGGLGPNQTKKDTEAHMKVHFEEVVAEASKEGKDVMRNMRASLKSMDLRHGVDSDKREAGYKMSPAVKAAQAKSDALSKVVKRPQAGTLAAVHKSMEREMLKKEEVEKNTSKKARKAAEKMVNRAKGIANKVNVTPELELGKPNA